jgi:hypothetical protein
MTKTDYETYSKQEDWELLGYTQAVEHDPRRHAALHILEMRRTQRAVQFSARAAMWAAIAAIGTLLVSVVGLFHH